MEHAPFLSTIRIGTLTYKQGNTAEEMMVSGGFCEVSHNKITFLVEAAERGHEIDVNRAMLAKERAEKRLAELAEQKEMYDRARVEAALERAMARLRLAEKYK